jgi:uncharacterized protein
MRIRVQDIGEAVKEIAFEEPTSSWNLLLEQGPVHDYEFLAAARVTLSHYRAGQNLFLSGRAVTEVEAQCARCLEHFRVSIEAPFSYVLAPRVAPEAQLEAEDLDLSFYEGEEIDVSPLVREQVLLSLPTRPLCREDCRGLCPSCGADLNSGDCRCRETTGDPRLAALRKFKVGS